MASQTSTLPGRSASWQALVSRNLLMLSCVAVLLIIILVSLIGPWFVAGDATMVRPRMRLKAPSELAWFGTDAMGRDVFALTLEGARLSLLVGFMTAVSGGLVGTAIGLITGYFRRLDGFVMRIMDAIMAIPNILFAVAVVSLLGPSLLTIVGALVFNEIPRVVRLVRSVVLSVREEPYVHAAVGMSIPARLILIRHILPSCIAPLIVQTTYIFAAAILSEAVLGFLGVGFPRGTPTWGNVVAEGRAVFLRAPWTIIAPGMVLAITVMSVNLLGDSLRDWLDPTLSRRAKVHS
ncbi:ABC-type transporter, integral membrane subunit [Rhizobium sp. CF080]|uniref:ABC transporter permease n=1 Tax=Rhizobium sp. (strain CF080) TaxID=1144310 RepID=UPI00027192C3|nr:ABC transporter permease [Rhizobium sp. CF080]EUB99846.1 ABC-type transporter, integral membrane subunit [Rhizobium sp. CF080]